jgi:undecaprenyl-diphosphatase
MLKRFIKKIIKWDLLLSNWVNKHQNKSVRKISQIITRLGSGYFWVPIYAIMFILGTTKFRTIVVSIVLAELLGLSAIIVLRSLVKRERPIANIVFLLPLPWQKNSFPSHHALRVSMLATIFGSFYPSWLPFLIFSATMVSISRIYLEMHYPFDVLTGSFLGFLCAKLVHFIF